jgi:translation initiation factor IF-2
MSKKELLERMTATPRTGSGDAKAIRRPSEPAAPAPTSAAPPADPRTQRVSAQVVRRRAADTPAAANEPPPVTTVRRRAMEVRETPAEAEPPRRPSAERSEPRPEPARETRAAEPPPEPAPAVHEPASEPAPRAEPAAEPVAATPAAAPVEAEPVPDNRPALTPRRVDSNATRAVRVDIPGDSRAQAATGRGAQRPAPTPPPKATPPAAQVRRAEPPPEARKPEPEPRKVEPQAEVRRTEVAPEPARRAEVRRPEPTGPRPVRPEPDASSDTPREDDPGVPKRARFEGLGKAVVMPPPGYDPTNPGSFRRTPAGPPAQQPRGPGGPGPDRRRAEPMPPRGPATVVSPPPGPGMQQPGGPDDRRGRPQARRSGGPRDNEDAMMRRRQPRRKPGTSKSVSPEKKASKRKIRIDNVVSVGQLAHELGIKATVVIKELMGMGRMATVNEMLDLETAALIASEFEYEVVNAGFQEEEYLQQVALDAEEEGALPRPPVVTIMGHVDHGKTTLLDAIRSAKVASGEAGGITQHIGAYQVEARDQKVTFIDTPGHAAFTAMRARGAGVTDVVVLVVAADDGVQAQTEEAISHARAAGVPLVVAINKIDKPGVNPDNIKHRLADTFGLVPEEWGGDTMFVPVSALKKLGIDGLLEAILLQAEVLELRANPERHAEGVVIEAKIERGRGPVASVLVQKGTLKRGDNLVLGSVFGRVRAMIDHNGKTIKEAGPSTPVEIFGLSELPETGDAFTVVKNEKDARALAEHRAEEKRMAALSTPGRRTAADIFAQAAAAEKETLAIILKADVGGSLEALKGALSALNVPGTDLRILHAAVGDISESDINLAAANGAHLFGFNVRMDAMARSAAEGQGVTPMFYDVIYAVLDKVTALMSGLLGPEYREVKQGSAEVRAVFAISKVGKIAGCLVTEGKVSRHSAVKVYRHGRKVHEGKVSTLKRFKDDAREVTSGYECGIALESFEEIEVGDVIETWIQEEIKTTLPSSR